MQKTSINYYGRVKKLVKKRRTNYVGSFGRVVCGLASGLVFLIFLVLALDISNMTFGRIGQIGDHVSVSFPLILTPYRIVLWNTSVETLELVKIIAALLFFVISSVISSIIFLQIRSIYSIFFTLGLEYLPLPLIGYCLKAQGSVLYSMMFIIGACLVCYSTVLRGFFERDYDYDDCLQPTHNSILEQDYDSCYVRHKGR